MKRLASAQLNEDASAPKSLKLAAKTKQNVVKVVEETPPPPVEENTLRMYWIETFENVHKNTGRVHLFGKIGNESCCVIVKNIEQKFYKGDLPKIPFNTKGETFNHVLNTTATAMERLLLETKLRGPCWIDIKNAVVNNEKLTHCELEYMVDMQKAGEYNIKTVDTKKPSPFVNLLSLNIVGVPTSNGKETEIIMISGLYHNQGLLDRANVSAQNTYNAFCFVTRPNGEGAPYTIDAQSNRPEISPDMVYRLPNENALLNLFFAKFKQFDPDVIITHDASAQISLLMSRVHKYDVKTWSLIGRLKQDEQVNNFLKSKAGQLRLMAGRSVLCSKIAAEELCSTQSYEFGDLVALLMPNEKRISLSHSQIIEPFVNQKSNLSVGQLIQWSWSEAFYALQLVFKLNALPSFVQMNRNIGGVLSCTLLGGRAERNEFLLLHAFNEAGYIPPDKQQPIYSKKGKALKKDEASDTNVDEEVTKFTTFEADELERLRAENAKMKERYKLLCRHEVYCFWDEDGLLLYAGQQTKIGHRIREHFADAIREIPETKFGERLKEELEERGVFAAVVFMNLDELQANEIETILIEKVKELRPPKNAGNTNHGRQTAQSNFMTREEIYAKADAQFTTFNADDLVTIDNTDKMVKYDTGICVSCQKQRIIVRGEKCIPCSIFNKLSTCNRCSRECFVNASDFCRNCNTTIQLCKKKNREVPAFDPSKSRTDTVNNAYIPRALAFSMHKRGFNTHSWHTEIVDLLGTDEGVPTPGSVRHWSIKNFNKSVKDIIKFVAGVDSASKIPVEIVELLIRYEHSCGATPAKALEHINSLFEVEIVLEDKVHEVYAGLPEIDFELEREAKIAKIDNKPRVNNAYIPRALAFSMCKHGVIQSNWRSKIVDLLGSGDSTPAIETVAGWNVKQFKKPIKDIIKFVANVESAAEIPVKTIDILISYEHSRGATPAKALEHINSLFEVEIVLEDKVHEVYAGLNQEANDEPEANDLDQEELEDTSDKKTRVDNAYIPRALAFSMHKHGVIRNSWYLKITDFLGTKKGVPALNTVKNWNNRQFNKSTDSIIKFVAGVDSASQIPVEITEALIKYEHSCGAIPAKALEHINSLFEVKIVLEDKVHEVYAGLPEIDFELKQRTHGVKQRPRNDNAFIPRSIAFSMCKHDIAPRYWHPKIVDLLGSEEGVPKHDSVVQWSSKQFKKPINDIIKFVASAKSAAEIPVEIVEVLIRYEHSCKATPAKALEHINSLFEVEIVLEDKVHEVYAGLPEIVDEQEASDEPEASDLDQEASDD